MSDDPRRRRTGAAGVLVAAAVAVLAASVPPTGGYTYRGGGRSVYDVSTVFLLSLLVVGAVSLLFRDRAARRVGAVLAIAAGAQLAGTGVVAFRRWETSGGSSVPATNEDLLRVLALLVAAAGSAAAVTGLLVLRRDGAFRSARRRRAVALVGAVAAICTAVALPLAMGHHPAGDRVTQAGAHSLMYGLPWAVVLLVGALADRLSAIAAALTVVCTAFPLLDEIHMIPASRPSAGFVVAALGACAVSVTSLAAQHQQQQLQRQRHRVGRPGAGRPRQ